MINKKMMVALAVTVGCLQPVSQMATVFADEYMDEIMQDDPVDDVVFNNGIVIQKEIEETHGIGFLGYKMQELPTVSLTKDNPEATVEFTSAQSTMKNGSGYSNMVLSNADAYVEVSFNDEAGEGNWILKNDEGMGVSLKEGETYQYYFKRYDDKDTDVTAVVCYPEYSEYPESITDTIDQKGQKNKYLYYTLFEGIYYFRVKTEHPDKMKIEVEGERWLALYESEDILEGYVYLNGEGHCYFSVSTEEEKAEYTLLTGYDSLQTTDITGYTDIKDRLSYAGHQRMYTFTAPVSGKYYTEGITQMMVQDSDTQDDPESYISWEWDEVGGFHYLEEGKTYLFMVFNETDSEEEYTLKIGYPEEAIDYLKDVKQMIESEEQNADDEEQSAEPEEQNAEAEEQSAESEDQNAEVEEQKAEDDSTENISEEVERLRRENEELRKQVVDLQAENEDLITAMEKFWD